MNFLRLTRGDVVAFIAALALLLVMSLDWYGTHAGDDARRVERLVQPASRAAGEVSHDLRDAARVAAEGAEKTAWQAYSFTDILLLAAIALAAAAVMLRALGRRFDPPATPSGLTAAVGALATLMVAYRIINPPGDNDIVTVKLGPFLGLLCVGILALGALAALRAEQDGSAFVEPPEPERPSSPGAAPPKAST